MSTKLGEAQSAPGPSALGPAPEPSTPEPTASPWIGRIIDGRYRVVELLAEGGMGTVFIAEHLKLRKMVALKTVHASFLGDEEVAARFAREAMASAQLEHPHVASALDYGALPDGGAFLVLELVHGPSLRAQIEKVGPAPWSQVCAIGAQIADALVAAHSMGIVHRDLKPENVLLEARHSGPPIAKVLDFGIARVSKTEASAGGEEVQLEVEGVQKRAVTQVGKVLGTPGYMAPEQAVGGAVDERADLYALGVIMWEMLAGWRLFDAPDVTAVLTQQFAPNASARLTQMGISVPPQLAAALDKLLEPQPKDRMQSALELRTLLRSIAARNPAQGEETYRIAMPQALRSAAPKLRTVLETVITQASPKLQALWARVLEWLEPLLRKPWLKTSLRASKVQAVRAKRYFNSLPRNVAWGGLAGAVLLLTLVVVSLSSSSEPEPAPELAPVGAAPRVATAQKAEPKPAATGKKVAPPPTPPAEMVISSDALELDTQLGVLAKSKSKKERRDAARWLQRPPADVEVPAFATALARLELGSDCRAQTLALQRLRTLGDTRALPALAYWNALPSVGCGVFEKRDCYSCIRDELRTTQRVLARRESQQAAGAVVGP